eukprot:4154058-Pleurochrysis_carterae.AAC.5
MAAGAPHLNGDGGGKVALLEELARERQEHARQSKGNDEAISRSAAVNAVLEELAKDRQAKRERFMGPSQLASGQDETLSEAGSTKSSYTQERRRQEREALISRLLAERKMEKNRTQAEKPERPAVKINAERPQTVAQADSRACSGGLHESVAAVSRRATVWEVRLDRQERMLERELEALEVPLPRVTRVQAWSNSETPRPCLKNGSAPSVAQESQLASDRGEATVRANGVNGDSGGTSRASCDAHAQEQSRREHELGQNGHETAGAMAFALERDTSESRDEGDAA